MSFALIVNNAVAAYPYGWSQLRSDNPQMSFPREMSDDRLRFFGVHRVQPTAQPAHDPITENVVEGTPALSGETWSQVWTVEAATAREIAKRRRDAAEESAASGVKADGFVANFIAMTPAELETFIDADATTVAALRGLVKKMALMLLILARREFR